MAYTRDLIFEESIFFSSESTFVLVYKSICTSLRKSAKFHFLELCTFLSSHQQCTKVPQPHTQSMMLNVRVLQICSVKNECIFLFVNRIDHVSIYSGLF